MERYCTTFPTDVEEWENTVVKEVDCLPFICTEALGQGVNCTVHLVESVEDYEGEDDDVELDSTDELYEGEWTDRYFGLNDMRDEGNTESDSSYSSASYSSEESSEEWSTMDQYGDCHRARQCMTSESPMGKVEMVAKKFVDVDNDVCFEGKRPGFNSRIRLEESATKYIRWLEKQTERVQTNIITRHITPSTACFSEFVSESICHTLLTSLVSEGITPHLVMALKVLKCGNRGYLMQERITSTIEEALEENPKLTPRDMAGMYLQLFITLHVLQDTCSFKHHDLHIDNVFIKRIDEHMMWNGVHLSEATHFSYDLGDTVLTIPNCGYIVKIGDFGISSLDMAGRKVQRLSLELYETSPKWGEWSVELEGKRGYDGQLLMGCPPFDPESWRFQDKDTQEFLRRVRGAAQGPNGVLTHGKRRPAHGNVSDVAPLDVVRSVFVQDPEPMYDFRGAPEGSKPVVVCMTSLSKLHTDPPIKPVIKKRRRRRAKTHTLDKEVEVPTNVHV